MLHHIICGASSQGAQRAGDLKHIDTTDRAATEPVHGSPITHQAEGVLGCLRPMPEPLKLAAVMHVHSLPLWGSPKEWPISARRLVCGTHTKSGNVSKPVQDTYAQVTCFTTLQDGVNPSKANDKQLQQPRSALLSMQPQAEGPAQGPCSS